MKLEVLDASAVERIHEASLGILEDVGVRVHHEGMLERLGAAGAPVDAAERRAALPAHVVESALSAATKQHVLYGRDPERRAGFGYGRPNAMSSAGQFAWFEVATRSRREPRIDDMRLAIRVGHQLPEIDIVGAMVSPAEGPVAARDVVVHHELLSGTDKPVAGWVRNGASARFIIDMMAAVRGGRGALAERPIAAAFVEPISPLTFCRESIEILTEFAQAGLPVGIGPMATCGTTAPGTLAGTLVQENAEILAGITMAQLIAPGLPVTYWGIPHAMDARTAGISFGAPEQGLLAVAMAQLGRRYGLPVGLNVGLTDSLLPDGQSGLEKGVTLAMGALAGADIFGHMGIAGADQGASLVQLAADNESLAYVRRILRGVSLSDDHLAADLIGRVGPGGSFLGEAHTLAHYRDELWAPRLLHRGPCETWQAGGANDLATRAAELAEEAAASPGPSPLPDHVRQELDAIVAEARGTLGANAG